MKYNHEYRWFQGAYFALYVSFASLSTYMIPFLSELGYDALPRGIMFSVMALVSIMMQFIVGYICDRFHIIKKMFLGLSAALVVSTYLFYQMDTAAFLFHLLLVCLMGGIYRMNYNLLDSWSLMCSYHTARKFGSMRAFGAVGFALGTWMTARLIGDSSYIMIFWITLLSSAAGMFCCFRIPETQNEKGWTDLKKEDFQALWETRSYRILILIFLCINIVGSADQYTTIDKMMQLQASQGEVGFKWAIQSLCEIPVFLGASWLLARLGGYPMMMLGTIFYSIKFLCYGLVSSVEGMLLVTTMQTITYPLITLSSRTLFARIAKQHPELKTSTQLIASSLILGLSALVAPLIGGVLISWIGHDGTLYVLACFLLPVLWYAFRERKVILELRD